MLITDLAQLRVAPDARVREAIATIDRNELQTAMVLDDQDRLVGLVTDGDVRRGLLRGVSLDDPVTSIQNPSPITVRTGTAKRAVVSLMRRTSLFRIPVVDESGRAIGLLVELPQPPEFRENLVVLMAGGLGTRLGDLTRDTPKPLLNVGPHPMLETIIEGFSRQGFHRFAISVNYKAEMIEAYFGDGSHWAAEISYVRENQRLGTAGALSLLPERPEDTFIVMNADVLTKVDFRRMLDFHALSGAEATMAVRDYRHQVPFGVVELTEEQVTHLVEKPIQRYFINAGIYALEPHCLDLVPPGELFDMTSLISELLSGSRKVASFPVHEYWQDVGQPNDLLEARDRYPDEFEADGHRD